jgi:hypothetical protein
MILSKAIKELGIKKEQYFNNISKRNTFLTIISIRQNLYAVYFAFTFMQSELIAIGYDDNF